MTKNLIEQNVQEKKNGNWKKESHEKKKRRQMN